MGIGNSYQTGRRDCNPERIPMKSTNVYRHPNPAIRMPEAIRSATTQTAGDFNAIRT
jgi:hypothetical protein